MSGIYRQRHPELTVFYRVFFHYFERFLGEQIVLTIPKMLRLFFRFKRSLLSSLCLASVQALSKYFTTVSDHELMSGIIAVIQTFGDRLNFHPHIHVLVTEGGIASDNYFHKVSRFQAERPPPSHVAHQQLLMAAEEQGEYF